MFVLPHTSTYKRKLCYRMDSYNINCRGKKYNIKQSNLIYKPFYFQRVKHAIFYIFSVYPNIKIIKKVAL
jgi:hypothetical protein